MSTRPVVTQAEIEQGLYALGLGPGETVFFHSALRSFGYVVNGADAIDSRTPLGTLNSKSFDVYDKGDRVIFKGGVHARLNSH